MTTQALNSWYKNGHLNVRKIFRTCPGVSAEWLITGEGEMLTRNRLPVLSPNEKIIPVVDQSRLLAGQWDTSPSFIVVHDERQQKADFLTRTPNDDLGVYFPKDALVACQNVSIDKIRAGHVCFVKTRQYGVFFVKCIDIKDGVCHFGSSRVGNNIPPTSFTFPSAEIERCAVIISVQREIYYPKPTP